VEGAERREGGRGLLETGGRCRFEDDAGLSMPGCGMVVNSLEVARGNAGVWEQKRRPMVVRDGFPVLLQRKPRPLFRVWIVACACGREREEMRERGGGDVHCRGAREAKVLRERKEEKHKGRESTPRAHRRAWGALLHIDATSTSVHARENPKEP
jgi:hypothetical protein